MPHRLRLPRLARPAATLCGVALLSACAQTAGGPAPSGSANDRSLAVVKQNPPGIVIFRGWGAKKEESAAPAASTAEPAAGATEGVAATAVAPGSPTAAAKPAPSTTRGTSATAREPGGLAGLLQSLPPPTGKPVQDLKKLNDPKQGIELPTAASRAAEKKDR